jgi:hypothetical protein
MAMVAIMMLVLLGFVGAVIDIGHAYLVQRSMQSSADAAALAGAANLPSSSLAAFTAAAYGGTKGKLNDRSGIATITETISTTCLISLQGCAPHNAVVVDEQATINTSFLGLFGVDKLNVSVRSTACSPCDAKPLDIVIVLDRTGSMCMDPTRQNPDPSCSDLTNARNGIKSFLGLIDPTSDYVGLAVLPPAIDLTNKCATPLQQNAFFNYNLASSPYVLVPLSNDYLTSTGTLNTSSELVKKINCVQARGSTSYATALEAAQAELVAHGRAGVTKAIIFFTDGAANYGPTYYTPQTSPYRVTPCHQGVASAAPIKAAGTVVITMGYNLDAGNTGGNICGYTDTSLRVRPESPSITAQQALQQIATGPEWFYNKPTTGDLTALFAKVAADIGRGAARLVPNDTK